MWQCTLSSAAAGAAAGFIADVSIATCGAGTAVLVAAAGGAICSGANSAYTQYTLTGDIDGGKVLSDTILGGVSNGLSTGMSEVLKPVVKGLSEGITHTVGQVAREIGMGIINVGQFVIDDLLPTAITGFGAWVGGLAYDFFAMR